MGDEVIVLCPGFRFIPSDEELLSCYLLPKLSGKPLPCSKVEDKKIYGPDANPWHLFDASSASWNDSGKGEKTVYVFTRLLKMAAVSSSSNKKTQRYVRKAGCGTWHDETGRKQKQIMVRNGDNVVMGYRKLMVYQINDIGGLEDLNRVGYWKMHEYCLDGFEDYVLCAITWDTSKKAKVVVPKTDEVVALYPETHTQQSDTYHVTSYDIPELPSEETSGVPVEDSYVDVQQESVYWMNTKCTQQALTSCHNNVATDGFLQGPGGFLNADFSDKDLAKLDSYTNGSLQGLEEFLNADFSDEDLAKLDSYTDFSIEEFLATMPSSLPDNNNDEQYLMQDYGSHVLGKRKFIEVQQSGKRLCI